MIVLAIAVGAMTLALGVMFAAVVAGIRQAHPIDLAQPHPTRLAALVGRVLGLYVCRGKPVPRADSDADLVDAQAPEQPS